MSKQFNGPTTVFSADERSKPIHRRSCCCCTCCCCCLIFLFLLVALAVGLFFLWPRVPKVDFKGIQQTTQPAFANNAFTGGYNATVEINNSNYIEWKIDTVETELRDRDTKKVIGSGELKDLTIERREIQNVTMPIKLNYTAGQDDAVTQRLTGICGEKKPLPAVLHVSMVIKGLKWLTMPIAEENVMLTCPN